MNKMIKTYEEALEVLGIKHFDETGLTPDEIAYKKLKVITKVLNDGWKADWNDLNQRKYLPWFSVSQDFAFNGAVYHYQGINAGYTASLFLRDPDTAEYAGKTFTELYKQFIIN